jgi:hypothetical protein
MLDFSSIVATHKIEAHTWSQPGYYKTPRRGVDFYSLAARGQKIEAHGHTAILLIVALPTSIPVAVPFIVFTGSCFDTNWSVRTFRPAHQRFESKVSLITSGNHLSVTEMQFCNKTDG